MQRIRIDDRMNAGNQQDDPEQSLRAARKFVQNK